MELFSVGDVAARLGVAPSTVRMWGTRYRLTASGRSAGGHRRYTNDDLDRLQRMHRAVLAGTAPAAAARAVLEQPAAAPAARGRRGGPGGSVLAVPGGGAAARGLARAATRLDAFAVEDAVFAAAQRDGILPAWTEMILPVLIAAGEHWQRTGSGIDIEHVLTQAVAAACVRHCAALPAPPPERAVVLAGGPAEEHVLPLHALRAVLTERNVPARLLGPRTPAAALAAMARRTRAAGVLVWLSIPDPAAGPGLAEVAGAHRLLRIVAGGPGWHGPVEPAARCHSLAEAADLLEAAWRRPGVERTAVGTRP